MDRRIYFDHAATTPLDREVLDKMLPYYIEEYGNADSPHAVGRRAMQAVDSARDKIAELIHAKPSEVYFTSGGTESDNWAILGGMAVQREKGKDHLIVSAIEHHAVLAAAEKAEKEGCLVTYLPVNDGGRVALSALKEAITPRTGLIAVMAANNETGVVQPIEEIAEIAKNSGILFFTDAVQYAPYQPLDVKKTGADLLSFSGHKFYGPKGCGVLYIKNGVKMGKHVVGGEQERGLRGGTINVPSVVGLAAAYEKTLREMPLANEKLCGLRALFLKGLSELGGVYVNGDAENGLPALVNVRFDGVENADILYNLDLKGICVAAGSACASASIKPSHVLTAMGLTEREAKSSVRFSFGKNNTEEEIAYTLDVLKEILKRLRK